VTDGAKPMVGEQKGLPEILRKPGVKYLFFTASFTKSLYVESQFNKVIA
jgi:hypothetical protein